MLTLLSQYEEIFGPLRLFRYQTLRAALAALTALMIGFAIGPWLIRKLSEYKMQQVIRNTKDVGKLAQLHGGKASTPTMGGLMIFASVAGSALLWAEPNKLVLTALFVYAAMTLVGFLDDWLKVSKRNTKGLASKWKLVGQAIVTVVVLAVLLFDPALHLKMRELWAPFLKEALIHELPIVVLAIFLFLVLAGSSNAINLTDGVDGLAIGCTITVALTYGIFAYASGNVIISNYLFISHVPGAGELTVVCAAMVGGGLAFLWYNSHPATVFMGDTGSLALGGLVGIIAFLVHQPLTLILVGGIFVMEATSVLLQVGSFKTTGKRIFRMAPIHHHFELGGWAESKVVIRFWILSLCFAVAGLATLKLR